jgi:hypothetical protein
MAGQWNEGRDVDKQKGKLVREILHLKTSIDSSASSAAPACALRESIRARTEVMKPKVGELNRLRGA